MAAPIVVIYLLTAVATGLDPHYKAGERHALITFICADTRDKADAELPAVLAQNGWRDWSTQKSNVAGPEAENNEGVRLARAEGAAINVYSAPLPNH